MKAKGRKSRQPGNDSGGAYPPSVDRLIAEFSRLPGIGRRSAERLAFHVLKSRADEAVALAEAIREVKENVQYCRICFNFAEDDECAICRDVSRDRGSVLVIEQPKDLIALELTGMYRGVYHVLLGRISPLDGVTAADLTIRELLSRTEKATRNCGEEPVREVILGLNPTLEGDGTGLLLTEELRKRGVTVSRLARGLPSGSQLEYVNKAVLADALAGRRPMND